MKRLSTLLITVLTSFFTLEAVAYDWIFQIDCYDPGVENTETVNTIYVTFWNGEKQLKNRDGTVPGHVPDCGAMSDASYKITDDTGTSTLTHVIVQTTGSDGFWINQVFLGRPYQKSFNTKMSAGMDNNKGWCLSTQKEDSGKFTGGLDSGCFEAIRFDVPSGKAHPSGIVPELKAYKNNFSCNASHVAMRDPRCGVP